MHDLARQPCTSWKTVWRAVEPKLVCLAADESGFEDVTTLGVDEHVWPHVDPRKRGPKAPGRSGSVYKAWLDERGHAFREGVKIAALDPFAGYKAAIDDKLQEDAAAVLDVTLPEGLQAAASEVDSRREWWIHLAPRRSSATL